MTTNIHPRVVSQDEWLTARKELLAKEKQLTRQSDAPPGRGRLTVFPRCSLLTYRSRFARRPRLEKQPTHPAVAT